LVTFLSLALVAIVLAFFGAACGSSNAKPVAQRPSTTAKVEIVAPTSGQVVTGSTLHVVLSLTGGTIVPTSTTTPVGSNEGHIHLVDNGQIISMAFGTEQDIQITPGSHVLQAEFVASDHLPFSPRVVATVHFTAQ
jgi:hypothetical protein